MKTIARAFELAPIEGRKRKTHRIEQPGSQQETDEAQERTSLKSKSRPKAIQQKRLVIFGIGGTGKSELCLKFIERHRKAFWGVFWVNCMTQHSIQQSFHTIGALLGIRQPDMHSVKAYLSNVPDTSNWLMILDNADDINHNYTQYFPSRSGNIIIIRVLRVWASAEPAQLLVWNSLDWTMPEACCYVLQT